MLVALLIAAAAAVPFDSHPLKFVLAQDKQEIPDLGTRKAGADWPAFLGPTGDGKSSEKGLRWPAEGPRKVWQRELRRLEAGEPPTEFVRPDDLLGLLSSS